MTPPTFLQVMVYGAGIILVGIAIWILFRVGSAAVFKSLEDHQKKKRSEFEELKEKIHNSWPTPPGPKGGNSG